MVEKVEIDVVLKLDKSDIDKQGSESGDSDSELDIPDVDSGKKGSKTAGNVTGKFSKLIGGTEGQASNLINFAKNPAGMLGGSMGSLGKAVPFIAAITAVLAIPKVIEKIGAFLTAPGGIFDIRLKLILSKAQNALFSR